MGNEGVTTYLRRLGRIRANELVLYGADGTLLYRSPPSTYKVNRAAPQWYAGSVRVVLPLTD